MTELLTAAQMRAIERAAIDSGEVTGLELMERAGRGTVKAILAEWPELAEDERRAAVLCGPGNNGGDGFVVARLLRERGWAMEVFLYGDPEKLPPDARVNFERWTSAKTGRPMAEAVDTIAELSPDLVVDAVFGLGLSRGPNQLLCELYREIDTCRHGFGIQSKVVAIDIPSGICSNSGEAIGECGKGALAAFPLRNHVAADLTVTFHAMKLGHVLADGPTASGKLAIVGLGSPIGDGWNAQRWLCEHHGMPTRGRGLRMGKIVARWIDPFPMATPDLKKAIGHKFDHGHALVLSGGVGRGGAARMAARGALRIGAGLVTLGCPPAAVIENAARLDAIMLRPVRDAEALAALLEDERLNVLCLGPGLGTGEREAALVHAALGGGGASSSRGGGPGAAAAPGGGFEGAARGSAAAEPHPGSGAGARGDGGSEAGAGGPEGEDRRGLEEGASGERRRATVLDGDALTILARDPALFALLHERCVLTPHAGEFARLFPDIAERLDAPAETGPPYSKVDAARDAAARAGCVVVFKGPDTVIADPEGHVAVNSAAYERSAPWLATAGSGDVLAGFVAGLLARGLEPMGAAEAAAWLHVECALEFGPGLIAEDLPEMLPRVLRRLGA